MKRLLLGLAISATCLDCTAQGTRDSPGRPVAKSSHEVQWNQFRGPNGQGVIDADQVPVQFGPDSNILWKTPIEDGQSSPVIWGDCIFLTTGSSRNQDELTTVCIDRERGKVRWRKSVRARKKIRYWPSNGPASPTPARDGEGQFEAVEPAESRRSAGLCGHRRVLDLPRRRCLRCQ